MSSSGETGRRNLIRGGVAAGIGTAAVLAGCQTAGADTSMPLNYVNVKATPYGAKGDGNSDDTAAVAAAYTAAAQQGRPLYFAPGTYRLTSLPAFATGTTVLGAGADQTTLLYQGNGTLLALRDQQRVSFKALGFFAVGATGTLIDLANCFRCSFDGVLVRGNHTPDNSPQFVNQTGIVLRDNTGGTSFVNCDINNFGRGLVTSCIQNYVTNTKFATNNVSILGTGNNLNAGLALANTEFVGPSDVHIRIDGSANDWWLSGVWFETSRVAVSVGVSGTGGPSQFGMVNCKVAASEVAVDIQHCRQPYLANVIFDTDGSSNPTPLRINPAGAPEGVAIGLITSQFPQNGHDFPLSTFPPGWTVLGRGKEVAAQGPIIRSPNGNAWRLTVNNSGVLSTTNLGAI